MSVINNIKSCEHTTNCTSPPHNCNKKKKSTNHDNDEKLRSFLISTNYDMIAITLMLALYHASTSVSVYAAEEEQHSDSGGHGSNESTEEVIENEESEVYAVLFPWFAEIVGVFVYYILSRYVYCI